MKRQYELPLLVGIEQASKRRNEAQAAPHPASGQLKVQSRYCIPDDQLPFLRESVLAPSVLPPDAPLARPGDFVFLSSGSAWQVEHVVFDWRSPVELDVCVWLRYVGPARPNSSADADRAH